MLRSVALSAVILGGAAFAQARPPATLVLANGERVSGAVAYHEDPTGSVKDRTFRVVLGNGRLTSVAFDDVVVIDFTGGRASSGELDEVDTDAPHLLLLKNGNVRKGRLIGIAEGDFIRWENEAGSRVDVLVRNVARIYLRPLRGKT